MPSRLIDRLLEKFPDTPRKRAKQWIVAGRVTVNGAVVRQPHAELSGEIGLLGRAAASVEGVRLHPRLTLLYLDSALAVVDKAAGLLSVPARSGEPSALEIVRGYRQSKPLPVHRLDQYTSGVFCMAMNPRARRHLIEQVKTHTMQREYIAYVEGRPPKPAGTWRHRLKLSDDEMRQMIVERTSRPVKAAEPTANGRDARSTVQAVTHYEIVESFGPVTKLRLRLESGLKHQIRVQAARAGCPLVGDRLYNPTGRIRFARQALHAVRLTLVHPDNGQPMTFTAPLPDDLKRLEARLRGHRAADEHG